MHKDDMNKALIEGAKREWIAPQVRRLDAGAAEANSTITGRGDGTALQES